MFIRLKTDHLDRGVKIMSKEKIELLVGEKAIMEAIKSGKALNLTIKRIPIPENVTITVEGKKVTVEGPKGKITRDFSFARTVYIYKLDNEIVVASKTKNANELKPVASIATRIKKMIQGVQHWYVYKHKVVYSHFPIRVKIDKNKRQIVVENFLGRKDIIRIPIYGEQTQVEVKLQPGSEIPDEIIIKGPDLEAVSQTSGAIHDKLRLKGKFKKDPRVFMDGIWRYEVTVEEE